MFLYIIRHAWAEDRDFQKWPDDDLRPLTNEGEQRFAQVAEVLIERGVQPSFIATSPLVRCRQTADILVEALSGASQIIELDALQPGSDVDSALAWTREQFPADVAWVGHAPDVGELAAALIGRGDAEIRFAKGAACAIEFDAAPRRCQGTLYWHTSAKLLGL